MSYILTNESSPYMKVRLDMLKKTTERKETNSTA